MKMQEQKLLDRKRKALNDGVKSLLASTCIDLAELYCSEGNYEEAIEEYRIVAEAYMEMEKSMDYAQANRMIGETYTHLRKYDQALRHQQIHLNVAKEQNDKLEQQRALATIGHTYLTSYLDIIDNPDKSPLQLAHKSFMKSLAICESLRGINKQEHKDMTARLLANIGVVHEHQGEYDKGIELIQKSIDICKAHDLYEQLERSYTFLAALYTHKGESSNAINQYNLAIEVAGRLRNKIPLMCASLSAKADILIKLPDFHAAKSVLLKAHKLKPPNACDREDVERKLKIVAAMCYTEDSLLTVSNSEYKIKKNLYEKLGDGASELKLFSSALEYYTKMLEAAEKNGDSGFTLSPCYISIAETYADMKNFEMAIQFYKKDYGVCTKYTKDSTISLLNIADCMEAVGYDIKEIESVYKQARNECALLNEKQLQHKVLSRHIKLLRNNNRSSDQLEEDLNELGDIGGDKSESEPLENEREQEDFRIGDDISIEDITDISDESDTEAANKPRTSRRRTKGRKIKRNNKGETQLHTACIAGNTTLVRHLLDHGHTVNVRDNCGWLPLHEAANYGYLEIVETLIEKGAAVNDRGGKDCNGMTPLHDAATNGHLEVIQLLLNKGASAIAKNDCGEMPLHILTKWRSGKDLDPIQQNFYEKLVERLSQDMEKSGHSKDVVSQEKNTALIVEETETLSRRGLNKRKSINTEEKEKKKTVGNLRKNLSFDEDLDVPKIKQVTEVSEDSDSNDTVYIDNTPKATQKEETNAREEYKRVMESLRYPLRGGEVVEKKRKSNESLPRSAYVQPDEVLDDWLEDDLGLNQNKKHKAATSTADSFMNTLGVRKTSSSGFLRRTSNTSLKSKSSLNDGYEVPDGFSDFNTDINEMNFETREGTTPISIDSDDDFRATKDNFVSLTKKRKTQSSLIDKGFTRQRSFSPTNFAGRSLSLNATQKRKQQAKISNFVHHQSDIDLDNLFSVSNKECENYTLSKVFNAEPTWSIDVRIDGKLYRVPVPATEVHTKTIKWLADEAAKRYSRKECVKPTLELETKNGAVLADDDFLSILFTSGTNQAEEVEARILKWNMPPLTDRYNETCDNLNIEPKENVTRVLQEVSTSLNISDFGLQDKDMAPICKIINRQINLHHINLSGNTISNDSFQLLCTSLTTLDNLTVLNLSLNHLTSSSLEVLADVFTQTTRTILKSLISLDLSYNPLGDESLKYLAIITRYLKLQILSLISVDFTNEIFDVISNRNVDLCLDFITNFDISYNQLSKQQINTFLSWLKPQKIEHLNVSNNIRNEEGLTNIVIDWLNTRGNNRLLNLRSLDLSRCHVTDTETTILLSALLFAEHFSSLSLRYNEDLTALSLRRLVRHQPSFSNLDLTGCKNIFKYFNDCTESIWNCIGLKNLRLSVDVDQNNERQVLTNTWRNKYQEKSRIVEILNCFIELSICE